MKRHFDEELKELHQEILRMGTFAQEAIYKSIEALKNRDKKLAHQIIDGDSKVDELELFIDDHCIDLIARHQPVASDLRFIATAMKINAELERIVDLAVDICQRVLELVDKPLVKPLIDTPKLSAVAQNMVRDAIAAFINRDVELAKKVVHAEPEADRLRDLITDELINDYIVKDGTLANRAVPLLLISRHLERICDHATNIAEDVIYIIEAKVIKHRLQDLNS